MYAHYTKNPADDDTSFSIWNWDNENFPQPDGSYPNLSQPRWTVADIYGPVSWNRWHDELHVDAEDAALPVHESTPFPYTVREGDTVDTIRRNFGVLPEHILELNPHLPTDGPIPRGITISIPWVDPW
jgi:LysM repeat protein